jgi:transcriptional regulator with XRE-family HTH domain
MRVGLKAAILARGLSQRQFARLADSSENRVSMLVRGYVQPTEAERAAFTKLLRQSEDVLFGEHVDVRLECRSLR